MPQVGQAESSGVLSFGRDYLLDASKLLKRNAKLKQLMKKARNICAVSS
jgi:hypothetical protein